MPGPETTSADQAYVSDLEQQFPRLVSQILMLWGKPEFEHYANKLIVDERGGRKGFTPEVMSELLFLYVNDMIARNVDTQATFIPPAPNSVRR